MRGKFQLKPAPDYSVFSSLVNLKTRSKSDKRAPRTQETQNHTNVMRLNALDSLTNNITRRFFKRRKKHRIKSQSSSAVIEVTFSQIRNVCFSCVLWEILCNCFRICQEKLIADVLAIYHRQVGSS